MEGVHRPILAPRFASGTAVPPQLRSFGDTPSGAVPPAACRPNLRSCGARGRLDDRATCVARLLPVLQESAHEREQHTRNDDGPDEHVDGDGSDHGVLLAGRASGVGAETVELAVDVVEFGLRVEVARALLNEVEVEVLRAPER